MKKYLIGVLALVSLSMFLLVGCADRTEPEAVDLTRGSNYWVEFEGERFYAGDPFSTIDGRFTPGIFTADAVNDILEPNRGINMYFHPWDDGENIGESFVVRVGNFTDEDILVSDGTIYGFIVNGRRDGGVSGEWARHKSAGFAFFNDIEIGVTTTQDIHDLFGEPGRISETDIVISLHYRPYDYETQIAYSFSFDKYTDTLLTVALYYDNIG